MNFAAWNDLGPIALAATGTSVAACLLTRVARRFGWVDGGSSERKRGVAPAPLIGGAAVLVGVLAAWLAIELTGRDVAAFVPGRALGQLVAASLGPGSTLWPLGALLTAFVVGTIDDVLEDGLRPAVKALGQALSGMVLSLPLLIAEPASAASWGIALLLAAASLVALNVVNTFDNADAAASGLGVVAFAAGAPVFAAALAAFLPWNLSRRVARGTPAILGDAGSHVIGMLFVLFPPAWPVLALPALDLARLAVVRARLGLAPWDGDRRHFAHRLQALDWRPVAVATMLVAIALPSAVASWWGAAVTALAYVLALRRTPAPIEVAAPAQALDARS